MIGIKNYKRVLFNVPYSISQRQRSIKYVLGMLIKTRWRRNCDVYFVVYTVYYIQYTQTEALYKESRVQYLEMKPSPPPWKLPQTSTNYLRYFYPDPSNVYFSIAIHIFMLKWLEDCVFPFN